MESAQSHKKLGYFGEKPKARATITKKFKTALRKLKFMQTNVIYFIYYTVNTSRIVSTVTKCVEYLE